MTRWFNTAGPCQTANHYMLPPPWQPSAPGQQNTNDIGQVFAAKATQLIFDLTNGQPWLVNAIARQLTEEIAPAPEITITSTMVEAAKEILIHRQDTKFFLL